MTRWFRLYDDAINDPKILKLSDKLHRIWIGLLCVASKNDGTISSVDDAALMLRVKPEKLADHINNLTDAGLIDKTEAGFAPHNWNGRQYKSDVSTPRVKRFRNAQRNVSETPPETEQIQSTEQKDTARAKAPRESAKRGTAFPEGFWLSEDDRSVAVNVGWSQTKIIEEFEKFRDHALAKGRLAKDWRAAWRSWVRSPFQKQDTANGSGNHNSQRRSPGADFFAGMRSVAEDIAGNRQPSRPADEKVPLGRFNIDG